MIIRKLTPQDAGRYRERRLEALKFHPEAFSSSYEEESMNSLELYEKRFSVGDAVTFGAFEGETLLGVVTLYPEPKRKLRHRANIFAMYVAPEARKTGIGKKLVEKAIDEARRLEGISHLYLSVTSINIPAKKLYESAGFTTFATDPQAMLIDGALVSEDLMVLKL